MAANMNASRLSAGLIARKGEAAPTVSTPDPTAGAAQPVPENPTVNQAMIVAKQPEAAVGRAGKKMSITLSTDLDRALSLRAIERGTSKLVLVYEALQQAGYPIPNELLLAWRRK